MYKLLSLFVLLITVSVSGQMAIPSTDYTSVGDLDVAYSKIRNFNVLPEGSKNAGSLLYDDVMGTPFWDINWNAAIFVLPNGSLAKASKARLNLYTNEVHFINAENVEMACDQKQIRKIFFFKGTDTSKPIALFELHHDAKNPENSFYYRVFNKGNTRLAELKRAFVKEKEYNPLLGKKEYTFYSKKEYLLLQGEQITPLPSVSLSGMMNAMPDVANYKEWLKVNNNKLKNEDEIVSFLNYYNTRK